MTHSFSELTKGISQKRREQIEQRKEEIRRKWFETPLGNKVKASAFRSPVSYCSSASK
jgi:hypothetical protein